MFNKKKSYSQFEQFFKLTEFNTKITLIFSYRTAPEGYDPYEKVEEEHYLNPKTIKGYVNEITPEAQYYKQYGLSNGQAKEIICDSKYYEWFKLCRKVQIDGVDYQVFNLGSASNSTITKRPMSLLRVAVVRK